MASLCRLVLLLAAWVTAINVVALGWRYHPLGLIVIGGLIWRRLGRWRGSGYAYGTARTASLGELARQGMLAGRGLIIGRVGQLNTPTRWQGLKALLSPRIRSPLAVRLFLAAWVSPCFVADRIIRINNFVHLAAFAPAGRGKGTSIVIPNLLSYPASCVIVDPKGENYKATATARRRMGHRIFRFNPFNIGGFGSDSFNPLLCLDQDSPELPDQCLDVANMLVLRTGTETDPHWNDTAEMVIATFLLFICACEREPANRTLTLFRQLVSSERGFMMTAQAMKQVGGVVTRRGSMLDWLREKELGSVMSTVNRQTAWMDSPLVAANLASGDFDPRILRTGRASVYLILPPDRLVTLAPLQRLWIGSILRVITRESVNAG